MHLLLQQQQLLLLPPPALLEDGRAGGGHLGPHEVGDAAGERLVGEQVAGVR